MKLRRQIAGRSVSAEGNAVDLIALAELDNLVKAFPVTVKREFELHILDLMIGEDLTLHDLDTLVFYEKLPH